MASIFSNLTSATKHTVATSTELEATRGGAHIYDIVISQDMDNGTIVGKGAYDGNMHYAMASSTAFTGKIIRKEANGIYQVQVLTATNAILLLQPPVIPEGYNKLTNSEYLFYNASGDIVRGYELMPGDVFGITAEGFTGTPAVGKNVSVSSYKLAVAA